MSAPTSVEWGRIAPYLDRALDLEGAQREAWLVELASTEPLIAATVRAMLAEHASLDATGFLVSSPFSAFTGSLQPGTRVGAYTIQHLIGRGGMGEVWLARRADGHFEGQCALKFLDLSLAGEKSAERFRREGTLLARLTHPNIARLLDAGTVEGRAYLALEYVDGVRIDDYCQSLTITERVRLFVGVVAAVAHAHSQLIVHRDLKPSNVLVTRDGQVKLLDFGIAKLLRVTPDEGDAELTRLEDMALTPEFAAPEQMLGDVPTTATDVYQLGMLLYVLLAGQHPIQSTGTRAEKIRAALDGTIPRASEFADAARRHEIKGDLDSILDLAMRRNPQERYATAQALQDELMRFLRNEPVMARRGARWYRVRKFVARHRLPVAASALTVLALVAGVIGVSWQAQIAQRARAVAETNAAEASRQRDQAHFEARVAIANQEFLSQIFGESMGGGENPQMRRRLDHARELFKARYADQPEIHAMLLMQLAGRYEELTLKDREDSVIEELRALAASGTDRTLQAQLECIDAYDLIRANDPDAAAPHVVKGLALTTQASRPLDAAFECWRADAMLAVARHDPQRGVARMNELLRWMEREGRQETRLYINSIGSLAYILLTAGNFEDALAVNRKKRALDAKLGTDATLSSFVDLQRETNILIELGRIQEAAATDAELVARFRAASDSGEIQDSFLVRIARNAILTGNHAQAVAWLIPLSGKFAREGPEPFARGTLIDLAEAQLLAGHRRESLAALQRFEARLANGPARPRELMASRRVRLALTLSGGGTKGSLEERRRELLQALEAATPTDRVVVLTCRLVAGHAAIRVGDLEAARTQAAQAMTLATEKRITGGTSAWVGGVELLLAKIDEAARQDASARAHLDAARHQFDGTLPADHWLRAQLTLAP